MRKLIAISAILFFSLTGRSQAVQQYRLDFCTYVSQNHECINNNNKFITSPDSVRSMLFMMLSSDMVFDTTRLTFKVYGIDRFDKEVFLFDVLQDVQTSWMTAWRPWYFTSPGKYMVKVYRDADHLLTRKGFEFFNL